MRVRQFTKLLVPLLAAAALSAPPAALASGYVEDRPSPEAMLVDGVVVRPLGLGATVVGIATWIVTLPFSLLGGNVGEAADTLIVAPAEFTFRRPLGEL